MSDSHTYRVNCPRISCGPNCRGEAVEARYLARTVEVDACPSLIAQGWTGPAAVLWHSQALELLTPADAPTTWQHADGLVTFRV